MLQRAYFLTGEFYYVNGFQNIALDYFLEAAHHAATDKERGLVYYAIGISSGNIHEASRGIDPNDYFAMSEELAKRTGDSLIVAQALFGRASGYFDFLGAHKIKNEPLYPARRDSIDTAVALLLEARDYAALEVLDYALGLSYAALKDFDMAQYYIGRVTGGDGSALGENLNGLLSGGVYPYPTSADGGFQTGGGAGFPPAATSPLPSATSCRFGLSAGRSSARPLSQARGSRPL